MVQKLTKRFSTTIRYTDRTGKASYIASKYAPLLASSVLDVGCDRKQLQAALPAGVAYTGVDIAESADVVTDLEWGTLPLDDRSVETVVAADVLEHVDSMHSLFDELCRVADKHIIVSLPNPYRNFICELARRGCDTFKYYGIGEEKPVDRHKWFFGAEDAKRFLEARCEHNGFVVEQLDTEDMGFPEEVRRALPGLAPTFQLAAGTIWCAATRRTA